ncbi:26S proteasome non-ATPase regulatory subunit 9-like isoform X2 [Zophobas morio]|uniref:26S proteasome non-ATPase regulatory subunit 9-like isoform X2 n=1 Tax=Zophobas morio TaxID=2755281 RepID=UPI003082C97E
MRVLVCLISLSIGFPRADVNVHSIRTARSIIIRLRNDLKEIEVQISECVSEVFKEIEQQNSIEATNSEFEANSTDNLASGIKNIIKKPFLTVSGVHSSSPAYACGLKSGDRILSIGSVHQGNFISLETLSEYIKHYENKELFISIIRNEVELQLTLIPKVWSGRGLLGCHLTPS